MDAPEVLSSCFFGVGQYCDTEWDMIPRWWQWGFGFGKERVTDPRGCFDGAYPWWVFGVHLEWGRHRLLPPIRVTFTRWSEEGECEYEFVFPPWDWQIDFPWAHRQVMKLRKVKRCEWWDWKARKG